MSDTPLRQASRPWLANLTIAVWLGLEAATVIRYSLLSEAVAVEIGFAAAYLAQAWFVVQRHEAQRTLLSPVHLATVVAGIAVPYAYVFIELPPRAPLIDLGIALGGALCFWAAMTLRRNFSVFASRRSIVTAGPYAWVRHPIYLSYIVADLAVAIAGARPEFIAIFVVSTVLLLLRIAHEENFCATIRRSSNIAPGCAGGSSPASTS